MAFVTLDPNLLDVGDPVKKEIFDTIKSNEDDLDSRLTTQENGAGKIIVYNDLVLNAASAASFTGLDMFRASSAFTLIDAKVVIFETGSLTGTLEIDIKKNSSLNPAGFTTVFTTKPSINLGTASDYDESTNAVFDSGQISVSDNDYLRFDVTSLPTPVIGKFFIIVEGEL